ncbi:MAG: hypothetical protein IPJ41_16195 [Phycisphaerales bacterium]|nr:hypothetical protein [Phycisphaerales bacterium]
MALTNSRKASIALLAVALGALAVDRFVLGGGAPQSAQAEGLALTEQAAGLIPGSSQAAPATTLSARFEQLATTTELDPLQVPDVFDTHSWHLTALVGMGEKGGVIVDGRLVRVGQDYQGAQLVSVSGDGAQFVRNGRRFTIAFEKPEGRQGR